MTSVRQHHLKNHVYSCLQWDSIEHNWGFLKKQLQTMQNPQSLTFNCISLFSSTQSRLHSGTHTQTTMRSLACINCLKLSQTSRATDQVRVHMKLPEHTLISSISPQKLSLFFCSACVDFLRGDGYSCLHLPLWMCIVKFHENSHRKSGMTGEVMHTPTSGGKLVWAGIGSQREAPDLLQRAVRWL